MRKSLTITIASFALISCGTVVKTDDEKSSAVTKSSEVTQQDYNAPQKAYSKANAEMHKGMGIIHADADIAFIQGMIPHHEGAVDMANIILEHGDDEDAKELARNIITAQEKEIAWMKNWLSERGLEPIKVDEDMDHSAMGH